MSLSISHIFVHAQSPTPFFLFVRIYFVLMSVSLRHALTNDDRPFSDVSTGDCTTAHSDLRQASCFLAAAAAAASPAQSILASASTGKNSQRYPFVTDNPTCCNDGQWGRGVLPSGNVVGPFALSLSLSPHRNVHPLTNPNPNPNPNPLTLTL